MNIRAPNPWAVAIVAAVCGGLVGGGGAALQSAVRPWTVGDVRGGRVADDAAPAGIAAVTETVHDFGTVRVGATGSYKFRIHNSGSAALTLTRGATSCSCTVSDFEASEGGDPEGQKIVPPGGDTLVTVQWRGKGDGGPFRQQATIFTSDPRLPEIVFVVQGTVVPTWKAVPNAVLLPRLTTSNGDRAELRLFTYAAEPPRVAGVSIDHPEAERYFTTAAKPLDAAEVATEPAATGGFLITIDVKPGLPQGRLRGTVKVALRLPEEVTAEIPIDGTVGGSLMLAGAAWDSRQQSLLLGTVSGRKGMRTQLFLTARGDQRDRLRPVVREVVPSALEVTVGEPSPVGGGSVVRATITVAIPPGSEPANHLCSEQGPAGKIVLDTGHPDAPTLSIPVCVAIGP